MQVIKRDGEKAEFTLTKINDVIMKAFTATQKSYTNDIIDLLAFKYKDCKREMDMVNKAFIETMIEGDSNGRGFQYPIPTYSITRDFDWSDTEDNRLLFEMTSKYGTPYFSNYIHSDMEPSDVRSMCCRLRLALRELRKKTGGFFGSGESTGSVGVVTVNLPPLWCRDGSVQSYYRLLSPGSELE
jgi:Oxygen-sensitive ribonucleoside-triphosphate reductase